MKLKTSPSIQSPAAGTPPSPPAHPDRSVPRSDPIGKSLPHASSCHPTRLLEVFLAFLTTAKAAMVIIAKQIVRGNSGSSICRRHTEDGR